MLGNPTMYQEQYRMRVTNVAVLIRNIMGVFGAMNAHKVFRERHWRTTYPPTLHPPVYCNVQPVTPPASRWNVQPEVNKHRHTNCSLPHPA